MMQQYKNLNGTSGITAFIINNKDSITIQFASDMEYTYTRDSAGNRILDQMQKLARVGAGLNAFINRNRPGFTSKVKIVRRAA